MKVKDGVGEMKGDQPVVSQHAVTVASTSPTPTASTVEEEEEEEAKQQIIPSEKKKRTYANQPIKKEAPIVGGDGGGNHGTGAPSDETIDGGLSTVLHNVQKQIQFISEGSSFTSLAPSLASAIGVLINYDQYNRFLIGLNAGIIVCWVVLVFLFLVIGTNQKELNQDPYYQTHEDKRHRLRKVIKVLHIFLVMVGLALSGMILASQWKTPNVVNRIAIEEIGSF